MTTTLVLIDLQRGMCDPRGSAGATGLAKAVASSGALKAAAGALQAAREAGVRVVHVRLAFQTGYGNRTNATARFRDHEQAGRFLSGSFDTQWCDEVAPLADETTLEKGSVSPFASTALLAQLTARRVDHVVFAGVATHLAVESAAREASDRGFVVSVLGEACAAPTDALHRNALEGTIPAFATVITLDELHQQLAQTPTEAAQR